MEKSIFITGTDTGVGKTLVTGLLGHFLIKNGILSVPQKWIQTGVSNNERGDIDIHLDLIGRKDPYVLFKKEMVPYSFAHPASPHLAASFENKLIKEEKIIKSFRKLSDNFEIVLVEGTGGFLVPITVEQTIADIVKVLNLPVLIISENCLGAINKTLLTIEVLKKMKMKILGVVFNRLEKDQDELVLKDNLIIIEKISKINVFGEIKYCEKFTGIYEQFLPIGEKIYKRIRSG